MRPHFILVSAGLICALPAAADELPKRKAGLWDIKMVVDGRDLPLRSVQQCSDAETDALMTTNLNGMTGGRCEKPKLDIGEGSMTVEATCRIGSASRTTRAVITGDLESAYTVAVTSVPSSEAETSGATAGGKPQVTLHAKWIGPCQKGQRAGDIILPGGIRLNVRSIGIETGTPR